MQAAPPGIGIEAPSNSSSRKLYIVLIDLLQLQLFLASYQYVTWHTDTAHLASLHSSFLPVPVYALVCLPNYTSSQLIADLLDRPQRNSSGHLHYTDWQSITSQKPFVLSANDYQINAKLLQCITISQCIR